MAKIRIHELAKEFKMNSKDLVARLRQMGYSVKNHMSTLEDKEVNEIRKALKSKDIERKKGTSAAPQKSTNKTESKETESKQDFRTRSIVRKEEQRQQKKQTQKKILAKVSSSSRRRTKKKRRDYTRAAERAAEVKV